MRSAKESQGRSGVAFSEDIGVDSPLCENDTLLRLLPLPTFCESPGSQSGGLELFFYSRNNVSAEVIDLGGDRMIRKAELFKLGRLAFIVFLFFHTLPVCAQFLKPTPLSRTGTTSAYRSVAMSGKYVHVVFWDKRDGHNGVFYKRSADRGLTWTPDIRLTSTSVESTTPSLSVSDRFVHLVWMDQRDGDQEIYYKSSSDDGLTWTADRRLTNSIGFSGGPSIVSTSTNVHVVWHDKRSGNFDVYYLRGDATGANWGLEKRISSASLNEIEPVLAVSGSTLHLVCVQNNNRVVYSRSLNNGDNWGHGIQLNQNLNPPANYPQGWLYPFVQFPSIAASGADVYVVWMANRELPDGVLFHYRPYFVASSDSGGTWSTESLVTTISSDIGRPSIRSDASNLLLALEGHASPAPAGPSAIELIRSFDKGATWQPEIVIDTSSFGNFDRPSISPSGDPLHIVWCHFTADPSSDQGGQVRYSQLPLSPDFDIDKNSLDLHSGVMEVSWPQNPSSLVHKQVRLWNTNYLNNPDPDGPSGDQTLLNVSHSYPGSPIPPAQQLTSHLRNCFPTANLSGELPAPLAMYNPSVVSCSRPDRKAFDVMILLPKSLARGVPAAGHIFICVPTSQPPGTYKAKVEARYRSSLNQTEISSDSFIIEVTVLR